MKLDIANQYSDNEFESYIENLLFETQENVHDEALKQLKDIKA